MVKENLIKEIEEFLYLNNISTLLEDYVNNLVETGFNIEKYGFKPNIDRKIEPVIIEKIVEKEIYVSNDSSIEEFKNENKLKEEEIKELKIKLLDIDKEKKLIENKYNNVIQIIENHIGENDFYGEEDDIIKKIRNEIKRK